MKTKNTLLRTVFYLSFYLYVVILDLKKVMKKFKICIVESKKKQVHVNSAIFTAIKSFQERISNNMIISAFCVF